MNVISRRHEYQADEFATKVCLKRSKRRETEEEREVEMEMRCRAIRIRNVVEYRMQYLSHSVP